MVTGNKIVYIKHKDIEGVNQTVIDMIANLEVSNFLDTIRLLRARYGIQQRFIAEVGEINYTSLSNSLSQDSITNWISVKTVEKAIKRMKIHFLKDVEIITAGV